MSRKVITKKDACAVAYYISDRLANRRSLDHATAHYTAEWHGKWRETDYAVSGPGFRVAAGRWKHADGRIRDAYSEAEGLLAFALYAVKNYPDAHPKVQEWAKALRDRDLVAATIDQPKAREIFKSFTPPKRWSFKALVGHIADAELLGKIAA